MKARACWPVLLAPGTCSRAKWRWRRRASCSATRSLGQMETPDAPDGSPLAPLAVVVLAWQRSGSPWQRHAGIRWLHAPLSSRSSLRQAIERVPILALGQLTPVLADAWVCSARGQGRGLRTCHCLARSSWHVWPGRGSGRPKARFWLVGAGLSLSWSPRRPPGPQSGLRRDSAWHRACDFFRPCLQGPPTSRWSRAVAFALVVFNLALATRRASAQVPHDARCRRHDGGRSTRASRATRPSKARRSSWCGPAFEPAVYFSWAKRDADGIRDPAERESSPPASVTCRSPGWTR